MIDMSLILNTEINRLSDEIHKLYLVIQDFKSKIKIPQQKNFFNLLIKIYDEINNKKFNMLAQLTENIPDDIAIKNVINFRTKIKIMTNYLYDITTNTVQIARELYHLCDIFLSYYDISNFRYIIYVADEIAMLSFNTLISDININEQISDFITLPENDFYLIMVIPEYCKTNSSLNWPIVLHEISHCIIMSYDIDDLYISHINREEAMSTVLSVYLDDVPVPLFHLLDCRRKLLITEHLADLLVTWSFGAIFGWRFIVELLTLMDVLEYPMAHPASDQRIEFIANELSSRMDLNDESEYLKKLIREHRERALDHEREDALDLEPEISEAVEHINRYNSYLLNKEKIIHAIRTSHWANIFQPFQNSQVSNMIENLHKDLLEGKPFIIEPPILYYLIILNFKDIENVNRVINDDDNSKYFRELIADIIRMYYLQNYYLNKL